MEKSQPNLTLKSTIGLVILVAQLASVVRNFFPEFPAEQAKFPKTFPTQNIFPYFGEKLDFIAFLLTNVLVKARNAEKISNFFTNLEKL